MNMKKLIESMDHIEECGMNEMPGAMPPAPMDQGQPVSMNVNLNASGKEHVEDLINMMKNAGLGDAQPVSAKTLAPRLDMERLRGIVDDPDIPGKDDVDGDKDLGASAPPPEGADVDPETGNYTAGDVNHYPDGSAIGPTGDPDGGSATDEGYANEPEEEYGDIEDVTASGNDLHKSKKGYPAAAGGDNPMSFEDEIKERLMAALEAKKSKPDYIDIDGDGNTDEPMKKAVKDKEEKED